LRRGSQRAAWNRWTLTELFFASLWNATQQERELKQVEKQQQQQDRGEED